MKIYQNYPIWLNLHIYLLGTKCTIIWSLEEKGSKVGITVQRAVYSFLFTISNKVKINVHLIWLDFFCIRCETAGELSQP